MQIPQAAEKEQKARGRPPKQPVALSEFKSKQGSAASPDEKSGNADSSHLPIPYDSQRGYYLQCPPGRIRKQRWARWRDSGLMYIRFSTV